MAKFEADIPSYLKSGEGAVPIDSNFEKVAPESQNLSEVIDNYTKGFSAGVRTPDTLVSDDSPVDETLGPRRFPQTEYDFAPVMPTLDPTKIKQPITQEVKAPKDEDKLPEVTGSDIQSDILIA